MIDWWDGAPRWIKSWVTLVVACLSTLTAGAAAWPIIEPGFPAHRAYVRSVTAEETAKLHRIVDPTRMAVIEMRISSASSRQNVIANDIARWELDLAKAQTDDDKLRIGSQIRLLKFETSRIDAAINDLRREREKE